MRILCKILISRNITTQQKCFFEQKKQSTEHKLAGLALKLVEGSIKFFFFFKSTQHRLNNRIKINWISLLPSQATTDAAAVKNNPLSEVKLNCLFLIY